MGWKEFTPEEHSELKKNPYVKSVTTKMVRFTAAFKEAFWKQYQAGKPPIVIVKGLGFGPKVLGESRINGILQHIKEASENDELHQEDDMMVDKELVDYAHFSDEV